MTTLFNKFIRVNKVLKHFVRQRTTHHKEHWSVIRKKKSNSDKALVHFDDFYQSVYGEKGWERIREALLSNTHKYVAILNNYSDVDRVKNDLENLGAMDLEVIYNIYKKLYEEKTSGKKVKQKRKKENIDKVIEERQAALNPKNVNLSNKKPHIDEEDPDSLFNSSKTRQPFPDVKLQSIETDITEKIDNNRIVKPSEGVTSAALYEYIPATKLKGMDNFILESQHFGFYKKGEDFVIEIEKEDTLNFPQYLRMYVFEAYSKTWFPKAKKGSTDVDDFYVLDGSSVLPVLSLDLKPGDVVLDMCSSPGGKSVTILQTMLPKVLVMNDIQESRVNKINRFFKDIFTDSVSFRNTYFITQDDARYIEDKDVYDKILVDVPCTTDRHSLHNDENNLFKATRVQERLLLPEMQCSILTNALKIVKLGGTVVYSTCTLSPVQNDGVVQASLKNAFQDSNVLFTVKNQTKALEPLKELFKFSSHGVKYGHLVIPTMANNWGPMYFCKMVRVQ